MPFRKPYSSDVGDEERSFFVLDPMLATGGTVGLAYVDQGDTGAAPALGAAVRGSTSFAGP
jgi:hypothetical protein